MSSPIIIKYWPILARGRGLFQMCAEAGVPFEHDTDMKGFGAALFGAESTNLAPPIIIDGDLTLSQSTATHQYLGKKFGLTSGIDSPGREALALQYMSDMNDLHSELVQKAMAGRLATPPDVAALQEYITGSRYKAFLAAINRAIAGPFFFGAEPTYVDYYADGVVTMCHEKFLGPLVPKSGDTLETHAPKLMAIVSAIRARASAALLPKVNPVPPNLVVTPERVATWA